MKKGTIMKRILVLIFVLLCSVAIAGAASASGAMFEGKWEDTVSQRAWMRIDQNWDGNYDVRVFWGGGIDTQQTLPFGTPEEVRKQVLERLEIFSKGGGYVFNPIHNVVAGVPVENLQAMLKAVEDFR